jgi:AraC-like DNA-binding protein
MIPVVTASLVRPFLQPLVNGGHDPTELLARYAIPSSLPDNVYISGQDWYDFAQAAAELSGDPYFGFQTGNDSSIETLPNFQHLDFAAATCGEVLTALAIDASRITTLTKYRIIFDGISVRVESRRTFKPNSPPAQIDAFSSGFFIRMLQKFTTTSWDPSAMQITMCDPDVIPLSALPRSSLIKGDSLGVVIIFPVQWLLMRADGVNRQKSVAPDGMNMDYVKRLRDILNTHIADPELSINKLSRITAISKSKIQSALASAGTSYTAELVFIRKAKADELLKSGSMSISAVGTKIGYPDPTCFSRAYKTWSGISPKEYRRKVKR